MAVRVRVDGTAVAHGLTIQKVFDGSYSSRPHRMVPVDQSTIYAALDASSWWTFLESFIQHPAPNMNSILGGV